MRFVGSLVVPRRFDFNSCSSQVPARCHHRLQHLQSVRQLVYDTSNTVIREHHPSMASSSLPCQKGSERSPASPCPFIHSSTSSSACKTWFIVKDISIPPASCFHLDFVHCDESAA